MLYPHHVVRLLSIDLTDADSLSRAGRREPVTRVYIVHAPQRCRTSTPVGVDAQLGAPAAVAAIAGSEKQVAASDYSEPFDAYAQAVPPVMRASTGSPADQSCSQ